MSDTLFGFLWGIIIATVCTIAAIKVTDTNTKQIECSAKGGITLKQQCVKVEIIK